MHYSRLINTDPRFSESELKLILPFPYVILMSFPRRPELEAFKPDDTRCTCDSTYQNILQRYRSKSKQGL